MTLFSRCEASQCFEPASRSTPRRRTRAPAAPGGIRLALAGFLEDIGILCRYAAGLDYYSRDGVDANR